MLATGLLARYVVYKHDRMLMGDLIYSQHGCQFSGYGMFEQHSSGVLQPCSIFTQHWGCRLLASVDGLSVPHGSFQPTVSRRYEQC